MKSRVLIVGLLLIGALGFVGYKHEAPMRIKGYFTAFAPEFFGRSFVQYNEMYLIKQWTDIVSRYELALQDKTIDDPKIKKWQEFVDDIKGQDKFQRLYNLNNYINVVKYKNTLKAYGEEGYWQSNPERFFREGGDCKDYTIAKYVSLRALGFSEDEMRVAFVRDTYADTLHSVLVVHINNQNYILDNQVGQTLEASKVTRYEPILSFNAQAWWSRPLVK